MLHQVFQELGGARKFTLIRRYFGEFGSLSFPPIQRSAPLRDRDWIHGRLRSSRRRGERGRRARSL